MTDREIAAALFISPRTASFHVANLLAKLGIDSRAAAAYAVRHGLA
jgi:DNA-binding CsgD family transcriptional regulator